MNLKLIFDNVLRIGLSLLCFSGYLVEVHGQQLIDCVKTGPCSCSTAGGIIDLSPLDSKGSSPPLSANSPNDEIFYYNPCSPFSLEDTECENAAICRLENNTYYITGTQDTADFKQLPDTGLHLIYTANNRASYVQLLCDQSISGAEFTATGEEDPQENESYYMTLKSKYACPTATATPPSGSGLSAGSILCILFAIAVFLYLLIGFIINNYVVGARGVELIPNVNFWKEFPFLVKDGVVFTAHGFKIKDTKYESI